VAAAERRRIRRLSGNGAREGKGRILDETFLEKRFRISPVRSDKTVPGELSSPSVCSAFSAVAARSASAPALVCHDTQITYADLDHVSSRIGTQLRHAGVRRGQVVGLIAHRSIETVAAILGILKAGGAYLPLDISYPPDLLRHICRDSGLTLTLIEHALYRNAKISNIWSGTTYYISLSEGLIGPIDDRTRLGGEGSGKNAAGVELTIDADDLAYVMYTSGSTGSPKGVMIPHRGIVRLVSGCNYVDLGPEEVILHLAPLSFDASTFELWGALLNGGKLAVLPTPHPSLDDIAEAIRTSGVTTLWLTAGLFHLMVENRLDGLKPLRQLIVGGEVLSPPHVAKALKALPSCRLVNGYGPTENTTFTCCYTIPQNTPVSGPIPIGSAIQETTVYVLDADRRPVDIGEEGELYAGGAGVALGYLNRPELTAERFVEDPFAAQPGARLYRTGDRVRQRPDGTIEFLGRVDRQIKLSGHRIELDAIEAHLRAEKMVQDAAVITRVDSAGRRSVAAFVTPHSLNSQALRRSLRARLPDFMVPASITVLRSLPLSPNGKVDRGQLADLYPGADSAAGPPWSGPHSSTESQLLNIVSRVLGRQTIGVEDNFFDVGASSLDLIRIHAKLVEVFGAVLTIVDLFGLPNIRSVAEKIGGGADGATTFISTAERARGRHVALRRAQLTVGRMGAA
jgi:amino acid adenylation domain-containing protein